MTEGMSESVAENTAALIAALRTALRAAPDSLPLHRHLAQLLMAQEDYAAAVDAYRQALELAPEDADLKLALATAYFRQGRPDVSGVIVEELLAGPAPTPSAYLLAARVYLAQEEPVKAASAYSSAILRDPSLADESLQQQLTVAEPAALTSEGTPRTGLAGSGAGERREWLTVPAGSQEVADFIERPPLTFADVGGMERVKDEIGLKIIYPLSHPELYQAYGKTAGGGILMYGPPGCGKTYLARATAGQVSAYFMAVGLHDVLDMYLGQSERKLHAIFELARHNTPCVLFFDEVDALGAKRSDLRHSAARQVINQFLSEMDGVAASNQGVLILAATNAPWHLDSALRRPGRFDQVIFVPPPDTAARAAILHLLLADKPTAKMDYRRLARQTEGFSGADLKGLVDVAVEQKLREAITRGPSPAGALKADPLTTHDLLAAMRQAQSTIQEWFATARNYAIYANEGGLYDEVLAYLKRHGGLRP